MLSLIPRRLRPTAHFAVLMLSTLLIGSTSFSALGQGVRQITFSEALQIALDRNIDLQKMERQVELGLNDVRSARADFLPNLNFSLSPGQQYGLAFDQTAGKLVSETSESFSTSIGSSVTLFDGFGNVANLRQSRAMLESTEFSVERSRQDVLSQVALQFLAVIEDREQIRIAEENLEAQRQLLARIQEFTRVGSRPISELYQQEAQVAQSELDLLSAERGYQLSQAEMIRILQIDPLGDFEFVAPAPDEVNLAPRVYDLQDLFDQAYQQRPDLRSQDLAIEGTRHGIDLARSASFPTIGLNANARTVYSSQRIGSFSDQLSDNRGGSLGFSLRVPIFNRLSTQTQVQRARVQYRNELLNKEALEQQVALEVRTAHLEYLTAVKRLDVSEKQLRSAEQALAAEQERFNVGASTLVELSQSRATYEQAASNRVSAIYWLLIRAKLLDYYTGAIDPTVSVFE